MFNNLGHVIDLPYLLDCFRRLDGNRAIGTDGITKEIYEGDLTANATELLISLKSGTYKPRPARLVEIPKEDGSSRPLAISCFEDKIVQLAVSRLLEQIYEPIFLDCSYGYRPGRNTHDALKALNQAMFITRRGAVFEIDLSKFFNTVPHEQLLGLIRRRISDPRLLALIGVLIRTPLQLSSGEIKPQTIGVPQGSIASPILANIYLHYVLDEWVAELKANHFRSRTCEMIRYADDMAFVFTFPEEAAKFANVLPTQARAHRKKIRQRFLHKV
ncbi:MAG TPA: reverse transcriptase domain-containing protein [Oligoflexus sp.]|uniref:reverse transcriptase domain-containing protein n=1 Tax=Oligoflexus sp. TaxID=1971216 RepID=UPI002D5DFD90|nr:reverse transcriptase domain-containing protein [Oligoflexus sp.]HYX31581.1 reverse transcriptase domain-containing protein [Oligoflexus sp.]